jgi:hypothetical protein
MQPNSVEMATLGWQSKGISGQQGFERTLKAFMLLPALIRLSEHFLAAL